MPFYDELTAATAATRLDFLRIPAIARGLRGDVSLPTYRAFLGQAYHHVRYTVPLMMACGSRLSARLEWLREAVGEYIEEEMGHQEWVLNDIRAAGGDADAARNSTPLLPTELMVAYAWDIVHRRNPVGFFGMVFVLEGTSVALATQAAEAIRQRLELPQTAFSYLLSHGSLDQSHLKQYETLVNRLDAADDRHAVLHAANMFYRLYGDMFRALPLDNPQNNVEQRSAA